MRQRLAASLSLWVMVVAVPTRAQFHRATDPVLTPASTVLQRDDAAAIDVDPAALGLLPSWSLTYTHAQIDELGAWLGQGDAVSFATPLPFGFALGTTVQSVRPGPRAAQLTGGPGPVDRALFGLAVAYQPWKRFSLAASGRAFASGAAAFDGLTAFDVGASWHAADWLGFSASGRDLFVSRKGFGDAGFDLGASLVAGWQVRPFGNSDLLLDFDVGLADRDRAAGRMGLGFRVPYLGYASSLVELERIGHSDQVYRMLFELDASFERVTVGGGFAAGEKLGHDANGFATARVEGQARPGVASGARVLDLELREGNERSVVDTLLTLDAALHDDRVSGVLLRPRGSGMATAYAQEIRLLVSALRKAGKRVICHLEDASGGQYYACAGADAVLLDPAGSLRLLGAAADVLLFGETLHKIGLRADFVRIGDYKSAPEQLGHSELSEPGREELRSLLGDVQARVLQDLGRDLHVSRERVAAIMDSGPQLAAQAISDKLVARVIDEAALGQGGDSALANERVVSALTPRRRGDWSAGPRIGVVMIDGSIVDGENVDVPFLGMHMSGGKTIVAAIDSMLADPLIRAIVLRVDSPGGAVLASDQIWRAVRRAVAIKPVVVSMGAVAASGGYYVAAAGDEIWADPSTMTGSIGIFYGKVDAVGLANKLGVTIESFQFGKRAGAESIFRPFTPDERAALADRMRTYYRLFLARVATGRGLSIERVDELGRGRVYSGDAALRLGLIDHLGGFGAALARARQLARLNDSGEVVVLPRRPQGLLDYVFGAMSGAEAQTPFALLPAEVRAALARAAVLQQLGAAPLALLPFDVRF
jgi:protease-4